MGAKASQPTHFLKFRLTGFRLSEINCTCVCTSALRPLTREKRFLLFLPDSNSHSAYYNSFMSALGRSLPPSLGLSRICCTWTIFWWKQREGWGGVGGELTHPRLQHWVKWLWERVWDF